jgi:large subunit ribosomal protein L25
MELNIEERKIKGKGEAKRLRRQGKVPGVVYRSKGPAQSIVIDQTEFKTHLRQIAKGCLSTTSFKLKSGKSLINAIVKDIQYDVTNYEVIHLDFQELQEQVRVNVNVPISCTGQNECAGVKQGGFVRQVIRTLPVSCLPHQIPQEVTLDVTELGIHGAKYLKDILLPEGVRPRAKMDEVAVVVAKR